MQGECVTPDEMRNHYYSLVPGIKCIDKKHYSELQKAKKQWGVDQQTMRSCSELGYD
jgi:hypothetical protein